VGAVQTILAGQTHNDDSASGVITISGTLEPHLKFTALLGVMLMLGQEPKARHGSPSIRLHSPDNQRVEATLAIDNDGLTPQPVIRLSEWRLTNTASPGCDYRPRQRSADHAHYSPELAIGSTTTTIPT
jgi:hypothetical protein